MAEPNRRATGTQEAGQQTVQSPERPETLPRRLSSSSAGGRSEPGRAEMDNREASIRSDPQRSRPRPQRLDYGMHWIKMQNTMLLADEHLQALYAQNPLDNKVFCRQMLRRCRRKGCRRRDDRE